VIERKPLKIGNIHFAFLFGPTINSLGESLQRPEAKDKLYGWSEKFCHLLSPSYLLTFPPSLLPSFPAFQLPFAALSLPPNTKAGIPFARLLQKPRFT